MASSFKVRVLQQSPVGPPPGSIAESSLPLTFFDAFWIRATAVERVFLFDLPHSTSSFIDSIIPSLMSCLSFALRHFYPLAGRLRCSPNSTDKYEIHYRDGDTVSFIVAESEADFQHFTSNHPNDLNEVCCLVPELEQSVDSQPLLALQVTSFPSVGVAIGIAYHHVICDGSSILHFVKSWASASKASGSPAIVSPPPSFDRSVIADPQRLYSVFLQVIKSFPKRKTPDSPVLHGVYGTFPFAEKHVDRLKTILQAKASEKKTDFRCSTFVVVCAYVYVCIVRAHGYREDDIVPFGFSMDCRSRLQPPLQASYFGNCIRPCFMKAKAGDLLGEDGHLVAAEAIGRTIGDASDDVLKDSAQWLSIAIDAMKTNRAVSVAGSPKFGAYDVDFGWGKPQKTLIPSIRKIGPIAISESREEQDGVEIGLVLPSKELMDKFSSHFFDGLQNI